MHFNNYYIVEDVCLSFCFFSVKMFLCKNVFLEATHAPLADSQSPMAGPKTSLANP